MKMRIGFWKINGTLIDGERYTIWAASIDQNTIWERQPVTTVKDGSEVLKSEVSHESISNKWFSKSLFRPRFRFSLVFNSNTDLSPESGSSNLNSVRSGSPTTSLGLGPDT